MDVYRYPYTRSRHSPAHTSLLHFTLTITIPVNIINMKTFVVVTLLAAIAAALPQITLPVEPTIRPRICTRTCFPEAPTCGEGNVCRSDCNAILTIANLLQEPVNLSADPLGVSIHRLSV